MMKNVTIVLFFLFVIKSAVGQKCEKKVDSFTKELVATFEWKRGGIRNLYYEHTKGVTIFEFRGTEIGAIEYIVPKGSITLIKLENDEILEISTINETNSTPASITLDESNNMTFSQYYLKFELSAEQLEKLARYRITDLRYPDLHGSSRSLDDKQLGNKWQRYVMDGAKCLMGSK